ncbi:hypothetical protein FRC14_002735 [Serendipita sp. 396]|nr:hypothetical protein FRC14_002735 [Serendipita sp. 396]KAG8789717.1 hypothetical protein FRC15_003786 [Serendipita sp. 397]KAG8876335.1 hypothetical protein FRC20_001838 [Serendipita sp. 405]
MWLVAGGSASAKNLDHVYQAFAAIFHVSLVLFARRIDRQSGRCAMHKRGLRLCGATGRYVSRYSLTDPEWNGLPVFTSLWTLSAVPFTSTPFRCTERFRVNMDRCLRGIICAWDGTETTTLQACPAIYCPGSIPQNLLEECSISTSGITNWNTVAPSTISPTPRPLTYTDSTTTNGTNPTASGSGTVAASTTASSPNAGDGFTLGLSGSAMLMFTFGISVILY